MRRREVDSNLVYMGSKKTSTMPSMLKIGTVEIGPHGRVLKCEM